MKYHQPESLISHYWNTCQVNIKNLTPTAQPKLLGKNLCSGVWSRTTPKWSLTVQLNTSLHLINLTHYPTHNTSLFYRTLQTCHLRFNKSLPLALRPVLGLLWGAEGSLKIYQFLLLTSLNHTLFHFNILNDLIKLHVVTVLLHLLNVSTTRRRPLFKLQLISTNLLVNL